MEIYREEIRVQPDAEKEVRSPYVTPGLNDLMLIIIDVVCDYFNTTKDIVLSKRRTDEVVKTRHLIIHFTYRMTNINASTISHRMNLKRHNMTQYALTSVRNQIQTNLEYRIDVEKLEQIIQQKCSELKNQK